MRGFADAYAAAVASRSFGGSSAMRTSRSHFTEIELRQLLRQAVVAAAAAVESYVAEKAKTCVADALAVSDQNRMGRWR